MRRRWRDTRDARRIASERARVGAGAAFKIAARRDGDPGACVRTGNVPPRQCSGLEPRHVRRIDDARVSLVPVREGRALVHHRWVATPRSVPCERHAIAVELNEHLGIGTLLHPFLDEAPRAEQANAGRAPVNGGRSEGDDAAADRCARQHDQPAAAQVPARQCGSVHAPQVD